MERQNSLTLRGASAIAMAVEGQGGRFSRPRLNARCQFSQETFAAPRGNGRNALGSRELGALNSTV